MPDIWPIGGVTMLESVYLFIAVCSLIFTIATILTPDDGWAIVLGLAGFLSWGVLAYASLNIVVVADAVTYEFTQPIATFFCVIMSLIPGYVALTGPADAILNYKRADGDDL